MFRLRAAFAVTLFLSACSPSLAPPYRDYEVRTPPPVTRGGEAEGAPEADVYARIRAALTEAGWEEASSGAPNIVSTAPRRISDWGLYRTAVSLDVAPIGAHHVRVFFHPVRYSVLGGRTKLGYLSGSLQRSLVPDLNAAFAKQGFVVLGTPDERDEETVDG